MSETCVSCFGIKDEEGVSVQGRQEGQSSSPVSCGLLGTHALGSASPGFRYPLDLHPSLDL